MDNEDIVIGRNSVAELLNTDSSINKIFIQKGERHGSINEIINTAKKKHIVMVETDRQKLDQMSGGNNHQGIVAVVPPYNYAEIEDVLKEAKENKEDAFIIILDGIEDPHNLGAIIRSAEVVGAHGVIIPKRRSAAVNATVNKSSAGALQHMKVARVNNITESIKKLKEEGLWIIGADMEGKVEYTKQDLKGAIAFVIGSEGMGISRLVKENCDILVKIPMKGQVTSLNASVSAALLMYEKLRQEDYCN